MPGYKDASEPPSNDQVHKHVDEEHWPSHDETSKGEVVLTGPVLRECVIVPVIQVIIPEGHEVAHCLSYLMHIQKTSKQETNTSCEITKKHNHLSLKL